MCGAAVEHADHERDIRGVQEERFLLRKIKMAMDTKAMVARVSRPA